MYLTSQAIKDEVRNGTICIDDFNEAQLQPNGYNLRLDREMIVYRQAVLNPRMQNKYERFAIPDEGFVLRPGKLYVGRTVEHIRALRHVPVMSGRFSLDAIGLEVRVSGGIGNVGYTGRLQLALSCIHDIIIYPDMEIVQLCFATLHGWLSDSYKGLYQDSDLVLGSLMYKED